MCFLSEDVNNSQSKILFLGIRRSVVERREEEVLNHWRIGYKSVSKSVFVTSLPAIISELFLLSAKKQTLITSF